MDASCEQSENAAFAMLVTLDGTVMVVNLEPLNAILPILVTLLGMVKSIKAVQEKKAADPMVMTP